MSPRPDVLTEATDLETLFDAILGKKTSGTHPTAEDDRPDEPPGPDDEIGRVPQPAPYLPPRPIDRRASSVSSFPEIQTIIEPAPRAEVRREPPLVRPPIGPIAIGTHSSDEPRIVEEDRAINPTTVRRLRMVRTSPWPVMVIVGGVALATVSAIGLRGGSSGAKVEPPQVASPPTTLPTGYTAQLPAAPLSIVDQQLAPPSTAFGDSPWRPAASAPRVGSATPAVSPNPTTPAPAPRLAAVSSAPAVGSTPTATTAEPPPTFSVPPARSEEAVEPRREAARAVEPAPSAPAPRAETPAPTPASPAVSSTRPSTPGVVVTEAVPELPKPAASRTIVSMVAARRLTGGMPEYSAALRQRKVWGVVDVVLRIDVNGHVVSANAVSGPLPLRQAAVVAVLKWQYVPATRNGVPIETESKVSFSFDPSQSQRP